MTATADGSKRCFRSKRTPGDAGVFLLVAAWKARAAATLSGGAASLVDLSVGTPDLPPPPEAMAALAAAASDPQTYRYCLRDGTAPLLEAAVSWFRRHYGVDLDPKTQALSLVGSQEGLAHLLMSAADPGDGVMMADVGYASYLPAARVAGLRPVFLPTETAAGGGGAAAAGGGADADAAARGVAGPLPDFSAPGLKELARGCKILLLNYPNNPTGAVADDAFWEGALRFCEEHDLLLVNDNPYVAQVYSRGGGGGGGGAGGADGGGGGGGLAASPLTRPGALGRCVELFSFAKSYQMGGARLGFALGNADALAALEAVKAPIDFNQYVGIQRMGIACLELPDSRLREYAATFESRASALVAALRGEAGWEAPMPEACMYLWTRLPPGFTDDVAFCRDLLLSTGVALAPGSGFGPGGRGCVRFALVRDEATLEAAAKAIGEFLRLPEAERLRRGAGGGESGGGSGGKA